MLMVAALHPRPDPPSCNAPAPRHVTSKHRRSLYRFAGAYSGLSGELLISENQPA
jgi:hypothetical protein